ncbi:MAG: hypothetical protein LBQ24_03350 [Candidatus Peribacteria bacterium]|nr:hypothetical protein [Candidatus Peribacteria bacterium]
MTSGSNSEIVVKPSSQFSASHTSKPDFFSFRAYIPLKTLSSSIISTFFIVIS